MKIGMTIEPFRGISTGKLLPFVRFIGLEHVELNRNIIPDIDDVRKKISKTTTTFHLPIYGIDGFDPGSTNEKSRKKIEKVISFLNTYHKELNLLFTLAHPPEAPDSLIERLFDNLKQINTPIILENIPKQSDEIFFDFYLKAKKSLGKQLAGHAIDAAHRFLTNNKNWLIIPKKLEKEITYVHLQDAMPNEDAHLPLGYGEMPYKDFLEYLKKIHYQGIINQEIKPEGFDLDGIANSCLNIARIMSKNKYIKLKARYAIIKPFLKRKITKVEKKLQL